MGNITAVIKARSSGYGGRQNIVDLTFSSSYATNGDVLPSARALGLENAIQHVDLAGTSGGYLTVYDAANQKIKLMKQTAATGKLVEETATTNVSTETVRAVIYGDFPNS